MSKKEQFLKEYHQLCEKHNLCLSPSWLDISGFKRDYHDQMIIVPFDDDSKQFLNHIVMEDEA